MKIRRPRRSAEETRAHLIEAGIADLRKSGMSIGLDAVNLEQAVRDANVSRSSAYVVWSNEGDHSPQEAFQRAVLCEVIENRKRSLETLARDALDAVAELDTEAPWRDQFRKIIRETAAANAATASEFMEWRIAVALRSVLNSVPEYRDTAFYLCEAAIAVITEGIVSRQLIETPVAVCGLAHPESGEGEWTMYALLCEKVVETFFLPATGTWADH